MYPDTTAEYVMPQTTASNAPNTARPLVPTIGGRGYHCKRWTWKSKVSAIFDLENCVTTLCFAFLLISPSILTSFALVDIARRIIFVHASTSWTSRSHPVSFSTTVSVG